MIRALLALVPILLFRFAFAIETPVPSTVPPLASSDPVPLAQEKIQGPMTPAPLPRLDLYREAIRQNDFRVLEPNVNDSSHPSFDARLRLARKLDDFQNLLLEVTEETETALSLKDPVRRGDKLLEIRRKLVLFQAYVPGSAGEGLGAIASRLHARTWEPFKATVLSE